MKRAVSLSFASPSRPPAMSTRAAAIPTSNLGRDPESFADIVSPRCAAACASLIFPLATNARINTEFALTVKSGTLAFSSFCTASAGLFFPLKEGKPIEEKKKARTQEQKERKQE